jgi:hypothetical protein
VARIALATVAYDGVLTGIRVADVIGHPLIGKYVSGVSRKCVWPFELVLGTDSRTLLTCKQHSCIWATHCLHIYGAQAFTAIDVQRQAAATVAEAGATNCSEATCALSRLAASGTCEHNADRDLRRLINKTCTVLLV